MNDDFAPRPKCRLPERIVGAFAIVAFVAMTFYARRLWVERDAYRDALAISSRVVDERNTEIDELRTIIRAHEATPYVLPDGELEPGAMGARFIPTAKDTNERLNNLVIRFEKILDDVEAGRTGGHIKFSLYNGTADVTLRKQP